MSSTQPRRRPKLSLVLSYPLAVLLPAVGSYVTQHLHSLQALPFSMHFIAVVCVAAIGGLPPAILAIVVSVCLRNLSHIGGLDPMGLPHYDPIRVSVILIAVLIVSFARASRLRSQQGLKRTFAELQERNDDLIASLGNSKCACWTFDLESGLSPRWYPGSYPIFGRPFPEIEAMPSILPLVHLDDHPRFPDLIEQLRSSHDPIVFEYRCLWPDGELHWLEMRATRIPHKRCAWRGVTLDITERKLAETALLRSEKLAAMGRLASTVAHEINNPLEAVTNLLYLARSDDSLQHNTSAYLAAAERELARLSNITRLTLGFVRISGEPAAINVAAVASEVITIFQHRFDARDVRLLADCDPTVFVHMSPHELRQIITNLIANAADAVSSQPPNGETACIALRIRREPGTAVLLLEDNGEGIDTADLSRIFEAFYSTKAEVGAGIGLWVSKEIVEKSGGRISVTSTRDRGTLPGGISTSFRVELPLAT
jgi:signal transduction histidine kinase